MVKTEKIVSIGYGNFEKLLGQIELNAGMRRGYRTSFVATKLSVKNARMVKAISQMIKMTAIFFTFWFL